MTIHILNVLKTLSSLSAGPAYLVGGTVRDLLLGRETNDIDLAVSGNSAGFAKKIADELGGTAFVMDTERDVRRVVVKGSGAQVDVSPLKGDITGDLAARDFTVNAMALPLTAIDAGGDIFASLIDPSGGRSDAAAGLIRAVSEKALTEDPLRLLRAFRLAQALGFEVEPSTLSYIEKHAPLVASVSAERVRDELYIMLMGDGTAAAFRAMADAGLLAAVLPETAAMKDLPQDEPHVHDVLGHSLASVEYAEDVMDYPEKYFGGAAEEVGAYLDMRVDGTLTNRGLVKLCALLHDVGKPSAMKKEKDRVRFTGHDEKGAAISAEIAARLRMSSRAADTLALTARAHMRPLHLSKEGITRHAMYRYARDAGADISASLVVALADAFATRDRPGTVATDVEGVAAAMSEYYYGEFSKAREEPLVRGRDLVEELGLTPGPAFGVILADVDERRAAGSIKTREEALSYIRKSYPDTA